MNSATLIEKLVAIEQAVGYAPVSQIRVMLADLEDDVLDVNRELIAALHEVHSLRLAATQPPRGGGPKRATSAAITGPAFRKPAQSSTQPPDAQPQHDLDFVRHMLLAVAQ
ncbi:MAG TPA: hypothetical protein VIY53_17120 [Acidobacteriaceae bacterium]